MGSKSGAMKRSLDKDRDPPEPMPLAEKQKKLEELELDMDNLAKEAECIICLDVPRGKVNCCQNGHVLCYGCQTTMKNRNRNGFDCPECGVPYLPCRNLFLGKFLALFYKNTPMKCKNDGCGLKKLMNDFGSHEKFCHHMQVDCPAKLVDGCGLDWSGSTKELSKHVKLQECVAINAHPPLLGVKDKNAISFKGEIRHKDGLTFFQRSRGNTAIKPILLLHGAIYRMWTFFQIERTFNARWIFDVWSALSDSALRDCKAEIIIYSNDGREYSAKMKINSRQSTCKSAAF